MSQDGFLRKLIEKAADCTDIDFSSDREQFNLGSGLEPRLQAADLRRLLLGRSETGGPSGFNPAQVHRWQITGATIEGRLDLRDARLPSGGPVPALEFEDCIFEQGIVADGAHLERLHLSRCLLGNAPDEPRAELSLQNVRVENEVRLRELGSVYLAPGTVLRVDANAIKVGGSFVVKHSTLRAPLNSEEQDPLRIPYALNLRNADIGADLLLQPDLTLHGGLVAVGARIRGDLRAEGLIADDAYTRDFRAKQRAVGAMLRIPLALGSANIGGNILLLTSPSGRRSTFFGEVHMYGIHIEGALHILGISIDATAGEDKPDPDATALTLALAQIKGTVGFYPVMAVQDPLPDAERKEPAGARELPVEIKGLLQAAGAVVGGDLLIQGIVPRIRAVGISVAGGLQIYEQLPVLETNQPPPVLGRSAYALADFSSATIKEGITSVVRYGYPAWKPVWKPEDGATGLWLTGAKVGGNLAVTGDYNYLLGDNLKLDGDGQFSAQVFYRLQLVKAKIDGDCDLSGFRFHPWNLRRDKRGIAPLLSMRDADVKRTLRLNRWSDQNSEGAVKFVEARECRPRCYPDLRIVEVKVERTNTSNAQTEVFWAPFIVFPGRVANVLTRSEVFHAMNARHYLRLDDKEDYRDYLRLFCAYVWGDEGAFAIVEPGPDGKQPYSKGDVEEGELPPFTFIEVNLKSNPVRAKAHVRYAGVIFAAEFKIAKSGKVEMPHDRPVCKLKAGVSPNYDPQGVARSGAGESDYRLLGLEGKSQKRAWLEEMIPDWKRPLLPGTAYLANANVDLRDAACGTLEDANGIAWGKEVRLALENFTYERIATDPFVRRAPWPWRAITEPFQWAWARRQSGHFYFIPLTRALRRWTGLPSTELPTILQELDPRGRPWFYNLRQSGLSPTGVQERLRWLEQRAENPARLPKIFVRPPRFILWLARFKFLAWLLRPADRSFPEPFLHQPYAQLAKVLREQGNDSDAKAVEEQRIRIESWLRAKRGLLGAIALLIWWIPYGIFFRYGLSPARAIATFVFCILIGFAGVHHAHVNHLLVQSTSTAATAVRESPKGPEAFVPFSHRNGISDFECGSSINELVYAVDVFIPLLNLHQEERCDVRPVSDRDPSPAAAAGKTRGAKLAEIGAFLWTLMIWPPAWQLAKFVYAVMGRVISSLMLLTVSGALRKWESK